MNNGVDLQLNSHQQESNQREEMTNEEEEKQIDAKLMDIIDRNQFTDSSIEYEEEISPQFQNNDNDQNLRVKLRKSIYNLQHFPINKRKKKVSSSFHDSTDYEKLNHQSFYKRKSGKEQEIAVDEQHDLTNMLEEYVKIKVSDHADSQYSIIEQIQLQERKKACTNISKVLQLRSKYIFQNHQNYEKILDLVEYSDDSTEPIINYARQIKYESQLPNSEIKEVQGVFHLLVNGEKEFHIHHIETFIHDLGFIIQETHRQLNKSLAYSRIKILEQKFNIHLLYNRDKELIEQKNIMHRDFYNIRKVDTHIHHSAAMRAKHLLRFITKKIQTESQTKVLVDKTNSEELNLEQVFKKLNITLKKVNLDCLDVQADATIFQRFDRFNKKYNPMGQPELRELFLKNDNHIQGRFLAEITKEIISYLEDEKYCFVEWRISIYGRSKNEWEKLANWVTKFQLFSHQVRWMIQIPRLYTIYRKLGIIKNFQNMIDNIFKPIFDVSINPELNPNLYQFLLSVVGFDTVDDESQYEILSLEALQTLPKQWEQEDNPHYAYWMYYIYANIYSLNCIRKKLGLNTFTFRPHCGESGQIDHLCTSFLTCDGINHGIKLNKSPVLQYLYYLKQIGIAMSPLSNNKLFLEYNKNPFPKFFQRGLNVSLSTDDPLIIHLTKEPLLEEYAVASQVWNLSSVDLAEIARNSVQQSSFEDILKKHWIGDDYCKNDENSNNKEKTNLPNIRFRFRHEVLKQEQEFLQENANYF